jgi:ATP-dependent protease ClpP protease subunit
MSKTTPDDFNNIMFPFNKDDDYFKEPVCFKDCEDHYELIYTGEFESIGRNSTEMTNLLRDLKNGDKDKELHILISSIGGDVENLILILQQVLQYNHRVTVCCGAALSAGFILWATGHEKYVSPYSELMYHTIYSGYEGKGIELTTYGNHIERLTSKLMEAVNMQDLISEEDMQKGKSTEVWYTGEDFINNGKAKDYSEYVKREIPIGAIVILSGGRFFAKSSENSYVELIVNADTEYTYKDLLEINQEQQTETIEEIDTEKVIQSSSSSSEEKKSSKNKKKNSKKEKLNINK